jgi:hypothetical protein
LGVLVAVVVAAFLLLVELRLQEVLEDAQMY